MDNKEAAQVASNLKVLLKDPSDGRTFTVELPQKFLEEQGLFRLNPGGVSRLDGSPRQNGFTTNQSRYWMPCPRCNHMEEITKEEYDRRCIFGSLNEVKKEPKSE